MIDRERGGGTSDRLLSAAAALLVLAVVAITIGLWVTAPTGSARFDLRPTFAEDHQVDVEIENVGGEVATEVVVRATFDDGTEVEHTVDWLSPGETNRVVFVGSDPASSAEVSVVSFAPDN